MAEAVVSAALETLGNLLIEEAGFLRGVRGQVEGLETELCNLQSLLKDADRKQHDSETVGNWIKQIRLLAYRAEDVLEEYVVKVGSRKREGFLNILKRFVCFATLHNLGCQIESIKSKIADLAAKMNNSGIQAIITPGQEETSDENKRRFIRQTYPHEEIKHFVGMEYDIEKLVSFLVSDHQESGPQVIGVWGMGGSGKTTVANKVYKHVQVTSFFESFAWVCITQKCQIQSVMEDIFRQLLPGVGAPNSNHALVEQIHKVQMEKKCLIVVDDIWKLEDWECLSKCLPNHASHSKVLLTTRNRNVAETAGYPIQLKGFTEDEAWELLRLKAFAKFKEPGDDSEYEKLGRTIIRKCDRLPLAIAVLGGILSGKNSLHEWKLANDDVNSYIGRGRGPGAAGEVEKVLGLSYDELPYHLKPCFLSLGFIREDQDVDAKSIYSLWTAQGFIQSKHVRKGETIYDVAKWYLYELKFRSMVQIDDISLVSLHDSMLDMCRSKAKEEEFLKVVDKGNVLEKTYGLVVHVGDEYIDLEVLKEVENTTPLRSLQIYSAPYFMRGNLLLSIPKGTFNLPQYKSLRILSVYSCNLGGKCFNGVENLIHLRYLCLLACRWESFSLKSVYKLSFLQTLMLSGTTILEMPPLDAFCKMPRLKHLSLPTFGDEVRIQGKLRLMNLSQLETLYGFDSNFYDSKDLIHLRKLQTLSLCWLYDDESLAQTTDYISGNSNLRWVDIRIENCDLDGSNALRKLLKTSNVTFELCISSCKLSRLPRLETVDFSQMCPGLVELSVSNADIEEDIMPALDKFPNLRKLHLIGIQFAAEEMVCGAGSFPRLEQLFLYFAGGNFELRIDEDAMPNLSSMEIGDCSEINLIIPERLKLFAEISL